MENNVPVSMDVIDVETGKVVETKVVNFTIMPVPETACQVCGRDPAHPANQPHDCQSLFYQYVFYGKHGRWPTWKDAVSHCDPETQLLWKVALTERGAWTE